MTLSSSEMFSTEALYSEWQTWIQKRTDKICWTHKPVNRQVSGTQMDCSYYSPYLNPRHFCCNFLGVINHMEKWSPIVDHLIKSIRDQLNFQKMKTWENNRTYLIKQKHQLHVACFGTEHCKQSNSSSNSCIWQSGNNAHTRTTAETKEECQQVKKML